jgi:oxalate decarboxylase/phosphoglucose isomerase-like protein (cupin superfamily)
MLVGLIDKPRGTGSRMHSHPNEQFNYVVKGTLTGSVNGVPVTAPAGTLVYIPANAPHTLVATPEEDVIFLALKDLSHGIIAKQSMARWPVRITSPDLRLRMNPEDRCGDQFALALMRACSASSGVIESIRLSR